MVNSRISPVHQAEHARQVVAVLGRMEDRIVAGRWGVGQRVLASGDTCLIGAIDEATSSTMPGVAEDVADQLAVRLPAPLRMLGRLRPRLALALYNDTVRDRSRVVDLIRTTHRALGGSPRHPAAQGRRTITEGPVSHVMLVGPGPGHPG